jgi:hypothetical protein
MARSNSVAFRREFTLTESGYAGSADGFFVGDIQSLHIDFSKNQVGVLLEGKVGKSGDWEFILKNTNVGFIRDIDISPYEYVRVNIIPINIPSVNIVLFGYEPAPKSQIQTVTLTPEETFANHQMLNIQEQMLFTLKGIEFHLSLITGEKYEN